MRSDSTLQTQDDLVVLDRRDGARNIESMRGHYQLKNWRDASGALRDFPCQVKRMSSGLIELLGPVTGSVGEWVTARFEGFGRFEGPIVKLLRRGFAMRIVTTIDDRKNIDGKIAWVENKGAEKRRYDRLMPIEPRSTLHMPDGHTAPCQVIDYSMSGAAIASDRDPEIGTMLIVGRVIGRVTRRFTEGFAIEFLAVRDPRNIEDLFATPEGQV